MIKGNNAVRRWAVLSGIAIQMGVIIYLFVRLGKWLDAKYTEGGKTFLIVCTLVGVGASLFLVLKQTNALNK
ncbi:MAG: AtpZ/AtpI family protein [Flavobacteriaceae bacterium]